MITKLISGGQTGADREGLEAAISCGLPQALSCQPDLSDCKKRQGRLGDTWHIDDVFVTIQGQCQYLWRAADQDGDTIDIFVQHRRNKHAAIRFFRQLLKGQRVEPRWLITDKLRSFDAAHRTIMPSAHHINQVYTNNRAEVSHEPTRQRERHMRRFFSSTQAQQFLTLHGLMQNLFRLCRHLMQAVNYRLLRTQGFHVWQEVVCAKVPLQSGAILCSHR